MSVRAYHNWMLRGSRLFWVSLVAMVIGALPSRVWVQAAPAAAPATVSTRTSSANAGENIFPESCSGERAIILPNWWDGVDKDNDLHVMAAASPVLNDIGQMQNTPQTPFPNLADMNSDGLNDLVVVDTYGFLWIYLNSGAKGQPKFTTGKMEPTFFGWASKINVCDWDGDGDNDIVLGAYYGDICIAENEGNRMQWKFAERMGVPRYVDPAFVTASMVKAMKKERFVPILMGKDPMIKGNYLSPWVVDWNKDMKLDLIFGEGTYSANSIRIAYNDNARNAPKFIEKKFFYLAYGEGFEHLTPAVVDYDGDGQNELICGTRTGQIRKFKAAKKGAESDAGSMMGTKAPALMESDGFIKIAGKDVFTTMANVFPCDWNEDGLFDLLMGKNDGKIYIAINTGTKQEYKFATAVPVKGVDTEKDSVAPDNWWNGLGRVFWDNYIGGFCNSALMLTAEKEVILKPGSAPITPVSGNYFIYFRYINNYPGWTINNLAYFGRLAESDATTHVVGGRPIVPDVKLALGLGKKYELSFSSILEGRPAQWKLWAREVIQMASSTTDEKVEYHFATDVIPASGSWRKNTYRFKSPNTVQTNQIYNFFFRMSEGDCKFMVDDIVLKQVE